MAALVLSFGLPQLIIGYSLLEGVGSALIIPPIVFTLIGLVLGVLIPALRSTPQRRETPAPNPRNGSRHRDEGHC